MLSGTPEHWHPSLGGGSLAYPVRCHGLALHGPRPRGEVTATLRQRSTDPSRLVFDVQLAGPEGMWCSFVWEEAVVRAGPLLGLPVDEREAVLWRHEALPHAVIGRTTTDGRWRVGREDLVEPLPGTLVAQCGTEVEHRAWREADDRDAFAMGLLAAKEALRAHLRDRLGRDVHPRHLQLLAMRPDRYVLVASPALTAQEWVDHAGPTRWHLVAQPGADEVFAWVEPADGRGTPPFEGWAVPATR
jgi:hypothetical protein